jgi:Caspase domain
MRLLAAYLCILTILPSVSGSPAIGDRNATRPTPLLFYASSSGHETLDQGDGGGNPFASSLIEILSKPHVNLSDLSTALPKLTELKSHQYQTPEVPPVSTSTKWRLKPITKAERRVALVIGISDYSQAGLPSLPGVSNDLERVKAALEHTGFKTRLVLNADRISFQKELTNFAATSRSADAAIIYTTGHGVEIDNNVKLILGDFASHEGKGGLANHSVDLSTIASSSQARKFNLVFYGGCRSNPFYSPN